jgi:hypothetical protein
MISTSQGLVVVVVVIPDFFRTSSLIPDFLKVSSLIISFLLNAAAAPCSLIPDFCPLLPP